jgi:acid phosphatase type 7
VIAAAGDVACPPGRRVTADECHQASTALLLSQLRPAAVLPIGDDQYETGALDAFRRAYAPTWGRFDAIVRPVPGNHEYANDNGTGYYAYFGARAGSPARGYYSYDLGRWHLIALNSNCSIVSCAAGSAQARWLRADMAAHRTRCTLAYWHHPRFSSGPHGNAQRVGPLWSALYAAGADVVLNGHDHDYERFGPQTPGGRADARRGIREFVAGTGGRSHYLTLIPRANSQRRNSSTFGVLALTLHRDGYSWRFVPEAGSRFTDSGTGRCH